MDLPAGLTAFGGYREIMWEVEKLLLSQVILQTHSRREMARVLGLSLRTVFYMIERHGLGHLKHKERPGGRDTSTPDRRGRDRRSHS
jgi:hypothetical protein